MRNVELIAGVYTVNTVPPWLCCRPECNFTLQRDLKKIVVNQLLRIVTLWIIVTMVITIDNNYSNVNLVYIDCHWMGTVLVPDITSLILDSVTQYLSAQSQVWMQSCWYLIQHWVSSGPHQMDGLTFIIIYFYFFCIIYLLWLWKILICMDIIIITL